MTPQTYVGITGFESGAQVGAIRAAIPDDRLLMIGCGMRGHPINWAPDKWPNRCPPPERLPGIFLPYRNVLNVLHFSPREGCNLFEHMCLAHEAAGPYFHGFQLNTVWPEAHALAQYKKRFPKATVTIALQGESLDEVKWGPEAIARKLTSYGDTIDRVILDPSAGEGKDIDVSFTRRTYEEIGRLLPKLGLVAAGGLHGGNVEEMLSGLLRQFPLSVDAESKLRTKPGDRLDMVKAIHYIRATDALLRKFEAQHTAA